MTNEVLSNRLLAVASLVRGNCIADIGTDHAMLPVYLAENGIVEKAVASDIHAAPLKKAALNIEIHGLREKIETRLASGLRGMESCPFTDIIMAGLGGLNIREILSEAPQVREKKTHLILQPMQHIPELRGYLYENGFTVDKEIFAMDEEKIYQVISAAYTGINTEATETEKMLGLYSVEHKNENRELFNRFCDKFIYYLNDRIAGLRKGGLDCSAEEKLLRQIESEKVQ